MNIKHRLYGIDDTKNAIKAGKRIPRAVPKDSNERCVKSKQERKADDTSTKIAVRTTDQVKI
jgi:hypothetical protein